MRSCLPPAAPPAPDAAFADALPAAPPGPSRVCRCLSRAFRPLVPLWACTHMRTCVKVGCVCAGCSLLCRHARTHARMESRRPVLLLLLRALLHQLCSAGSTVLAQPLACTQEQMCDHGGLPHAVCAKPPPDAHLVFLAMRGGRAHPCCCRPPCATLCKTPAKKVFTPNQMSTVMGSQAFATSLRDDDSLLRQVFYKVGVGKGLPSADPPSSPPTVCPMGCSSGGLSHCVRAGLVGAEEGQPARAPASTCPELRGARPPARTPPSPSQVLNHHHPSLAKKVDVIYALAQVGGWGRAREEATPKDPAPHPCTLPVGGGASGVWWGSHCPQARVQAIGERGAAAARGLAAVSSHACTLAAHGGCPAEMGGACPSPTRPAPLSKPHHGRSCRGGGQTIARSKPQPTPPVAGMDQQRDGQGLRAAGAVPVQPEARGDHPGEAAHGTARGGPRTWGSRALEGEHSHRHAPQTLPWCPTHFAHAHACTEEARTHTNTPQPPPCRWPAPSPTCSTCTT